MTKMILIALCLATSCFFLNSCSNSNDEGGDTRVTPAKVFTIDTSIKYQTITGFGGANRMWTSENLSTSEVQNIFGTADTELGLTIFRERIPPVQADWTIMLPTLKAVQAKGIKILASPWSPPANLKSNNDLVGGHLLPENYEAYKNHLNDYISFMANNGVTIYAISIQNEPDIQVSYESCDWTATQMADYIKAYGSQINAKIVAPESFKFDQSYVNALFNDTEVINNLDIVGGHIYGSGLDFISKAEQNDKEIWMTEYLLNLNTGNAGAPAWSLYGEDIIWNETLTMLETIHKAMDFNWNAYIWWYIKRYYSFIGDGTQGTESGKILKRGYAFSHFSKYVRPGYVRVQVNNEDNVDLKVTAYESNTEIVIEILNTSSLNTDKVQFKVPSMSSAMAYQSTLEKNREPIALTTNTDNVQFSFVPKKSITTVIVKK
ncbi:hypothetical protein WJN01_00575 [Flavobacteriaceae bacterium SZ-1-7]|uniref:hypothetical protein n=1 Tax=Tamlana sedimenti TaxID=3134126 RepID=UPI003126C597